MVSSKVISNLSARKAADALVLPFFEGQKPAFSMQGLSSSFKQPLAAGDFKGAKEEVLCHYPGKGKEKRLILVGLGREKELSKEGVRRSYAQAIKCIKGKAKTINIQVPKTQSLEEKACFVATFEGALLANYVFDDLKSKRDEKLNKFTFIGGDRALLDRLQGIISSVFFARDLVIGNADEITPTFLAQMAKELARESSLIKTTILNRQQIEKENLGLLVAVSRASSQEPALIVVEYRPVPKSKEITVLVGKGITYDTGGLNLKPTGGMETMREDMSGAATVLGTLRAACALKLPLNIVGVIASTENAIGPKSYKPGDVYRSHAGVTVEIANTDAEGRLVLADALSYAQEKFQPKRIIDIATLTGGAVVALGEEVAALMANDEELAQQLIEAGESTYERLWRLPLYQEYKELLQSKVADIKNVAARKASPIQGGIFLQCFIKKTKWAHIDIAGVSFPEKLKPYHPVQATGVGVRLLVEFFEQLLL